MNWLIKEESQKHKLGIEGASVRLDQGYLFISKGSVTSSYRINRHSLQHGKFGKVLSVEYYEGTVLKFGRFELIPDIPGIEERLEQALSGPQDFLSPMTGKVLSVNIKVGDIIKASDKIMVVEAMKMENPIKLEEDAEILSVHSDVGAMVDADQILFKWQRPS